MTTADQDLVRYYSLRAREYDEIYTKPERQDDLRGMLRHLRRLFCGHRVLELAAGTGHWTEIIASVADSILATDMSPEVLQLAHARDFGHCEVEVAIADAYELQKIEGDFTAAFAGFFWSHVPRRSLDLFLDRLHDRMGPGALIVFLDNRFVPGSSTPISHVDAHGDSFQVRELKDGSRHNLLKNFPDKEELRNAVAGTLDAHVALWPHYWCLSYRVGAVSNPPAA
ncbi:MAG: class I SAM-dependent methyltransferase [bacterium]|nr:class I SAM-dependent methyltransferase [bacterium]